jgi:hypothetical protein
MTMMGHDSGYYTQAEVNELLADMQAQFDCAIAELRDELSQYIKKPYLWSGESVVTISSHVADGHVVDPDA